MKPTLEEINKAIEVLNNVCTDHSGDCSDCLLNNHCCIDVEDPFQPWEFSFVGSEEYDRYYSGKDK